MPRPRVLHLINSFEIGGTELQAIKIINSLAQRDYEIFVASLSEKGTLRKELDWLKPDRYKCFPLTSFYDANCLKQLKLFRNFLEANRITLVHSHDFYTNIFGMTGAFLNRIGARVASKRATYSKGAIKLFVERQSFRLAKKIATNSNAVSDFLTAYGIPKEKLVTIYNGLDVDRFIDKPAYDYEQIEKLTSRLNPHAKVITIVANMRSRVKNHDLFLRGAQKIADQFPRVEFVLVGDGDLREAFIAKANDLGIGSRCHFTGNLTAIPEVLSISSIGVLCSDSEGFSNAILEYMAAGLPVVATDVGGAREAIIEGKTGFLIPPGDEKAFVRSVMRLLTDTELSHALGNAGRSRALTDFSRQAQIDATISLYNSILK